jgi:hypothetical protein
MVIDLLDLLGLMVSAIQKYLGSINLGEDDIPNMISYSNTNK